VSNNVGLVPGAVSGAWGYRRELEGQRARIRRLGLASATGGVGLWALVCLTGVYGGYFGAAQGVILISLLSIFLSDDLQRLNGLKNVLAGIVNGVAAVLFVAFHHIHWGVVGLLAAGSIVGGQLGATVGRRIAPAAYRTVIVVVGLVVAAKLLLD
jgi:uncharacterized membrane protein YfcA